MTAAVRTTIATALIAALAGCNRPTPLPDVGLSTTSLAFEAPGGTAEAPSQTFYVVNTGSGSLSTPALAVTYADGADWLEASLAGAGAPYAVSVTTRSAGLEPGVYEATLTVSVADASSSPIQLPVKLTVPDPRFLLSTNLVSFAAPRGGSDPAPQAFQVTNAGRGTLPVPTVDVAYVGAAGWLTARVGGNSSAYAVTLSASVTGLASGTYDATLAVSAAGAEGPPRTLAVRLVVPPPELALSESALLIQGPAYPVDPAPVTLAITNPGGGILSAPSTTIEYAEPYSSAWLTAEITGDAAPYTLTLTAHQAMTTVFLESGAHHATVTVAAPGIANAPQAVAVTIIVPPPVIDLSPPHVQFDQLPGCGLPASQTVAILNVGPGSLARPTATVEPAAASWLQASVTGDWAPYTLELRLIDPALIADAVSTLATVQVTSPGASGAASLSVAYEPGDPAFVPVTSFSRTGLGFRAQLGAGDPPPQEVELTTAGGCIPPPSPEVSYGAGDPAWITAEVTPGLHTHRVAVRAAALGLAHQQSREAWLSIPGVVTQPASVKVVVTAWDLQQAGAMAWPRTGHQVTAIGSSTLVTGGAPVVTPSELSSATSLPAWSSAGMMTHIRRAHGAVALPDGVLACGGQYTLGVGYVDDLTCEYWTTYSPYPVRWYGNGSLNEARLNPSLVPLTDHSVLIVSPGQRWAEVHDTAGYSSWSFGPNGASGRAVKLADGRVLVAGGTDEAAIFDPATDSWSVTGSMSVARPFPALALLPDGRVLAVGGSAELASAEIWDPATGDWTPTAPAPSAHVATDVTTLSNGKVVAVAGAIETAAGTIGSADVELFDPASETWSVGATLPAPRRGAVPVVRSDGALLIVGGEEPGPDGYAPVATTFIW